MNGPGLPVHSPAGSSQRADSGRPDREDLMSRDGLIRSSWLPGARRSSGVNLVSGAGLVAVGLWDLWFVLFRSESPIFMVVAGLLLLVGVLTIARGLAQRRA
jgi:hypothetical protein